MNTRSRTLLAACLVAGLSSCVAMDEWATQFDTAWNRSAPSGLSAVVINGRALDQSELYQLQTQYGVTPIPGRWWYDPTSGLWGPEGQAAAGFMLPGHAFGPLAADASGGASGVFVNGRELTTEEFGMLASAAAQPLYSDRYWFDGNGAFGYEGQSVPLGTFHETTAASQGGGGWGQDNFYASRTGYGNYNADNSQGYVHIPGHGAVTYGF